MEPEAAREANERLQELRRLLDEKILQEGKEGE
jgi:hypothetical protein